MEYPVNTQDSKFDFDGHQIDFITDTGNNFWFQANHIAEILGYKHIRQALKDVVPEEYQLEYEHLLNQCCGVSYSLQIQQDTIFVNEPGLYTLICSSTLPQARSFRTWVFEKVLPAIKKSGEEKYKRVIDNLNQKLQETETDRVIRTKDQNKNPYFYLIKKNVDSKYPYYVLRVQKRRIQSRLSEITKAYPRKEILLRLTGNPYTVNLYNRIKESGYIEFRRNEIRTGLSEENLIHAINEIDFQRF